ncbi:(E3-independent) E2 ubiquitin-conjugating enzyme UBE2O-like isoform X2 [Clytia hemisphaerica]|uniref:UBC core domain-containing protein n=1 Tax=Clytia hemisphaerica TaxID=252671 RepID=A0A7M5VHH2_9CNID
MAAMRKKSENETVKENDSSVLFGIFEEDLIQTRNNKKQLGIVTRAYYQDDESDDSFEDEDEEEKLEKGKVEIGWYSMNSKWNDKDTEVVNESTVELVDRAVMPGHIVRWSNKSNGIQKATVKNVQVYVDLQIVGTNQIVKNINAENLLPLSEYRESNAIVKGPWLGNIQEVHYTLTLVLKNKARCIISGEDIADLVDITDQRDEDSTFYCPDFYPGQQVQGAPRAFKEAKYISGVKPILGNQRSVKAIVEKVEVSSVDVEWHVSGYSGDLDESIVQPSNILSYQDLQSADVSQLKHFKEAHLQVGDKAFYVLTEENVKFLKPTKVPANTSVVTKRTGAGAAAAACETTQTDDEDTDEGADIEAMEEDSDYGSETPSALNSTSQPKSNSLGSTPSNGSGRRGGSRSRKKRYSHLQKKRKRYRPFVNIEAGNKICVEVCRTRTVANVEWQDGTFTSNVASTDLFPSENLDELEFFPGDYVIDKRVDAEAQEVTKYGVVQTADFTGRICNVRWLYYTNDPTAVTVEEKIEEDVSVYDITYHPDFSFRPGDIVVRLSPTDKFAIYQGAKDESGNANRLSSVGQVIQVNSDGRVDVVWIDKRRSSIIPSELYSINQDDWDGSEHDYDDDGEFDDDVIMGDLDEFPEDDDGEWETSSETSDTGAELRNQLSPLEDVIQRSLNALIPNTATDVVVGAPEETTQLPIETSNETPLSEDHVIGMNRRTVEFMNALDRHFFAPVNQQAQNEQISAPQRQSIDDEPTDMSPDEATKSCFQTLEQADQSHQFYSTTCLPINPRKYNAAIMKDMRLMRSHLPPGIIVKSFQDRIDLLSILITGPVGTPYEDGLFVFDLQYPDNYPIDPPNVHYHAFCTDRLNPNLYQEGKVCVSLLGTWTGKGNETWTSKSTVHQLLLSIQGLILNAEPYFNEAGYEKQRGTVEGKENSRVYNEMALIKMIESLRNMIQRPPKVFQDEIRQHFQEKLPRFIQRMEHWLSMEGASSSTNSDNNPQFPLLPISKGFRVTVRREMEKLKNMKGSTT